MAAVNIEGNLYYGITGESPITALSTSLVGGALIGSVVMRRVMVTIGGSGVKFLRHGPNDDDVDGWKVRRRGGRAAVVIAFEPRDVGQVTLRLQHLDRLTTADELPSSGGNNNTAGSNARRVQLHVRALTSTRRSFFAPYCVRLPDDTRRAWARDFPFLADAICAFRAIVPAGVTTPAYDEAINSALQTKFF